MFKRLIRMFFRIIFYLFLAALALPLLARLGLWLGTKSRIVAADQVEAGRVAIVFGAGLDRNGTPTPILRDRVAAAADLYFAGKVEKLLMSGDNRFVDYNEPQAMKEYAVSLGVPAEAVVLDYAGRRTYDTCYRAGAIFGLSEAVLVTQRFHLPRALFLCDAFGLEAVGVAADGRSYYRKSSRLIWNVRETGATLAALWDVYVRHPQPVLGDPEPIFPEQP